MTRLAFLALPLLLAACGVRDRAEFRYRGHLTPTAASARCQPTDGVALVRDGHFTFAPDDGTWVLEGVATADALQAKRSRLTPDRKSYDTELKATWTQADIHGAYTTPFCTFRVDLAAY